MKNLINASSSLRHEKLTLLAERERRLGLKDLFYFSKHILGFKDFDEGLHGELARFTTSQTGCRKKLVLLPRGTFKSTAITIAQSLWEVVKNPDLRILIDSEKMQNSSKFLSAIKGIIETNQTFKNFYGDLNGSTKGYAWSQYEATVATRTRHDLKEPTFSTAGVDVVKVGMHYDLIIMDDPVSENNTTTKEQIQKVIDHYKFLLSILEPTGRLIIIGTRWDYGDLYGYILEDEADTFDSMVRQAYWDDEAGRQYLFPQRLTPEFLAETAKSQGSYIFSCTPGDADILMADFSQKPIKDVKVGDKVVGYTVGSQDKRGVLVETEVLEVNNRLAQVQTMTMSSGDKVRCTADHHWFTGRGNGDSTHRKYAPANVGSRLTKVINSLEPGDISEWRYLAGLIDGEGACKHGSISIAQSRKQNPEVCDSIRSCLYKLKLPYTEHQSERKECSSFVINGGRSVKAAIMNYGQPAKKRQILSTILKHKSRIGIEKNKVVGISKDGDEMVYALVTGTGNYVSQGYASKNCQYLNSPVDKDTATFRKSWIKYWDGEVRNGQLWLGNEAPIPLNIFTMIDPAISQAATADYSAIVTVGVDQKNNLYVIECVNERLNPYELDDMIFKTYEKWKPVAVGIERHANQSYFAYTLPEAQKKRATFFRIEELKPFGDKESRIRRMQPMFEAGAVFLKRKGCEVMEDQLLRFPYSRHDDVIDALGYAPDLCYPKRAAKRQSNIYQPISSITGY